MTPLRQTAFRLPDELLDAMQQVKEQKGIPLATQVRFAVTEWLKANGVVVVQKSERKQAATRKRP